MRMSTMNLASFVAVLAILFPLNALANPGLVANPAGYHFGEVAVDSSDTITIRIENNESELHWIDSVTLWADGSPYFSILSAPDRGTLLVPGASAEVEVSFAPSAEGYFYTLLLIGWINGGSGAVGVKLEGEGIAAPGEPMTIQRILTFFYKGVDDGTIVGVGRNCSSRRAHLKVFELKLLMVKFFIEKGWHRGACKLLWHAHARSDGQKPPKDWIDGDEEVGDIFVLNSMILELLTDLGCL